MSTWTKRRIEKRLGGYRQIINTVQSDGLERPESERKVAVVGGGLAGLAAAYSLAERGFKVDVYEAAGHLGGKCGAWPHTLKNGDEVWVEHGFLPFFDSTITAESCSSDGSESFIQYIRDYHIVGLDWSTATLADIETTPVLNLLSLWKKGLYKMSDIVFSRAIRYMPQFLKYDPAKTFEKYDTMSYDTFCERAVSETFALYSTPLPARFSPRATACPWPR